MDTGINRSTADPGLSPVFSQARGDDACGMTGVAVEAQAARAVNLCKTYGASHATVRALDNVSVTFERGRFTAVMGPSGSQRVACARALINKPELVFADEPTGNLDSNAAADLLAFLRRSVRELGQSVVMVTHDPRSAAYADRVVFLADGAVVSELSQPTADSVLERMRTLGA